MKKVNAKKLNKESQGKTMFYYCLNDEFVPGVNIERSKLVKYTSFSNWKEFAANANFHGGLAWYYFD